MPKQPTELDHERRRCSALVSRVLDAVLDHPPAKGTREAMWTQMLAGVMKTIRNGGDVIDLERALPEVFGG